MILEEKGEVSQTELESSINNPSRIFDKVSKGDYSSSIHSDKGVGIDDFQMNQITNIYYNFRS